MKVQAKHGKVTQNMHGTSRNYRYVWDVSNGGSIKIISKTIDKIGGEFGILGHTACNQLCQTCINTTLLNSSLIPAASRKSWHGYVMARVELVSSKNSGGTM